MTIKMNKEGAKLSILISCCLQNDFVEINDETKEEAPNQNLRAILS